MERNSVLNPSIYAYLVTTIVWKKSWTLGLHVTFKPIQSYITHLVAQYLLNITMYTTTIWPVALCRCETSSPTTSDDHRLWVYDTRVLRKIFGPKRGEVTTGMEETALCGAS